MTDIWEFIEKTLGKTNTYSEDDIKVKYNEIAKELHSYLPYIPKIEAVESTKYYEMDIEDAIDGDTRAYSGLAHVNSKGITTMITIVAGEYTERSINEVICHELAHVIHFDHGVKHEELTKEFIALTFDHVE